MTHPRITSSSIARSQRLKSNTRAGLILTTLMLMVAMTATPAAAQTYTVLYHFDGTTATQPSGTLAQGRDGNLYGTAGSSTGGVVFKITPDGAFRVIYNFGGNGGAPSDGLTLGYSTDGSLYGTAAGYGETLSTIFKITPHGNLTTLHTFSNYLNGPTAYASPILGSDGSFYGMTTISAGVAYKISPSGTYTEFAKAGLFDQGYNRLLPGTDGVWYGVASQEVFKLTSGLPRSLYTFHFQHSFNYAVVEGPNGNLYGTTSAGGSNNVGEVYELTPQGSVTVLHNFGAESDGVSPLAGLVLASDGNFYGVTGGGGSANPGTLFRVSPTGQYSVVQGVTPMDGREHQATLMQHTNGKLYGVAYSQNLDDHQGVVYSLDLGLPPFVKVVPTSGKVGTIITILGQGFTGVGATHDVSFNGIPALWVEGFPTYLKAAVPGGATTGPVTVTTLAGTLTSNQPFRVHPVILSVTPGTGAAGTPVVITGTSFTETTKLTFGGGKAAAAFTVDSDTQVTATVPAGAPTGYIVLTTAGGRSRSPETFTVTP